MSSRGKYKGVQSAKRRKSSSAKKKKELDLNKLVNIAVKTGKVKIGYKSVKKHLYNDDFKLIILAKNCPEEIKEDIDLMSKTKEDQYKVLTYPSSSWELGTAAGKPYMIATLGIINPGDSLILDAYEKLKKT